LLEQSDDAVGEGGLDCGVSGGGTNIINTNVDDGMGDGGVGEDIAVDTGEAIGT
jgi:hypothetical protein